MSPRKKDKSEANKWTRQEISQLIASIKAQLKPNDPLPYNRRISVLNWKEVGVPNKSVKQCKGHLDVVIKKIHRTRTLAEILSDVSVEPTSVISEPLENNTKGSLIVRNTIDTNNNSPATYCFKRKSKRLSEENVRRCSKESSNALKRLNLNPSRLFTKHISDDSLKDQCDKQADGENFVWNKNAAAAAFESKELTFRHEENKKVLGKENGFLSLRKRKLEPNDYNANQRSNKRVRKTPVQIEYSIVEKTEKRTHINLKPTPQDLIVLNGNVIDQICGSSDVAMEKDDPVNSLVNNGGDELPQDLSTESTGIASLDLMTDTKEIVQFPWIKEEIKQEVSESPHVFARIRSMFTGLFGRIGTWMVKQE